jgi:putative copper export protein/methionine-rich copper-binding protein CopC
VLILVGTLSGAAKAHTWLERSSPAAGDTVRNAPTAVRLWFSGRAELAFTRVRLLGADGREIPLGPVARLGSSRSAFSTPIGAPLSPGTYTVEWQTAAADGHPVRGRFSFTMGGVVLSGSTDTARAPVTAPERVATMPDAEGDERRDYQVARWAGFVGLLAVLGVVVFQLGIVGALERHNEPTTDLTERARQIGLGAVVLVLSSGVYRLFAELRAIAQPRELYSVDALTALLTTTAWGRGWLVGVAGAIVLFASLVAARRGRAAWWVAAVGALGVALSPALTGHAASAERFTTLSIVVDVLHVLGAGAWLGTLLVVVLAEIPAALRRVPGERGPAASAILRAFHPLALACVPLVVASGLISTGLRLGNWSALTSSRYGTYVLVKVALFACVAIMGAYNWRRMLPALGEEQGARRIRRTASVELAIGALILVITAVLVVTPIPR